MRVVIAIIEPVNARFEVKGVQNADTRFLADHEQDAGMDQGQESQMRSTGGRRMGISGTRLERAFQGAFRPACGRPKSPSSSSTPEQVRLVAEDRAFERTLID